MCYMTSNTCLNQTKQTEGYKIINLYFTEVFDWLKKCEKLFGFNLKGYNTIRMYTFLAERFLPYWFNKYTRCLEWPVVYCDINKNNK